MKHRFSSSFAWGCAALALSAHLTGLPVQAGEPGCDALLITNALPFRNNANSH